MAAAGIKSAVAVKGLSGGVMKCRGFFCAELLNQHSFSEITNLLKRQAIVFKLPSKRLNCSVFEFLGLLGVTELMQKKSLVHQWMSEWAVFM